MKCNHRLGWWAINDNIFECAICGERVDKKTCDQLMAEEKKRQENCPHTNRKQIRGNNGIHEHCCDCGKLLD